VFGVLKFVWLSTLKKSARICALERSDSESLFAIARSNSPSRSLQYVASYVAVGPIGRRNERVRIEVSVRSTEN